MWSRILVFVLLVLAGRAQAGDVAGSGDNPLLPRYPGSEICASEQRDFDAYPLVSGPARSRDAIPTQTREGRVTRNMYVVRDGDRSALEVMRNYRIALEKAGFEEIFACDGDACADGPPYKTHFFFRANPNLRLRCKVPDVADWGMPEKDPHYFSARLVRPGEGDVHVAITVAAWALRGGSGPRHVFVQADVIEQEAMQVGMELKRAEEMASDITANGRAVLYGIQFASDSAALTAASEPTLSEIAALLATNAKLRLLVVGHTDNQGSLEYNRELSTRRSRAVVDALAARHGVAKSRLEGHGVGYLAPVAPNRTEEGRALNRRVELVEQ